MHRNIILWGFCIPDIKCNKHSSEKRENITSCQDNHHTSLWPQWSSLFINLNYARFFASIYCIEKMGAERWKVEWSVKFVKINDITFTILLDFRLNLETYFPCLLSPAKLNFCKVEKFQTLSSKNFQNQKLVNVQSLTVITAQIIGYLIFSYLASWFLNEDILNGRTELLRN